MEKDLAEKIIQDKQERSSTLRSFAYAMEDFGFDPNSNPSMDGKIFLSPKGGKAVLFAKSQSDLPYNKTLESLVEEWKKGVSEKIDKRQLKYEVFDLSDLPQTQKDKITNGKSISALNDYVDRGIVIQCFDVDLLRKEMRAAKLVLDAMGYRKLGPNEDIDLSLEEAVSNSHTESMEIGSSAGIKASIFGMIHLGTSVDASVGNENSVEKTNSVSIDAPLGAIQEWIALSTISKLSGADGQPGKCLSKNWLAIDEKSHDKIIQEELSDAEKIRSFAKFTANLMKEEISSSRGLEFSVTSDSDKDRIKGKFFEVFDTFSQFSEKPFGCDTEVVQEVMQDLRKIIDSSMNNCDMKNKLIGAAKTIETAMRLTSIVEGNALLKHQDMIAKMVNDPSVKIKLVMPFDEKIEKKFTKIGNGENKPIVFFHYASGDLLDTSDFDVKIFKEIPMLKDPETGDIYLIPGGEIKKNSSIIETMPTMDRNICHSFDQKLLSIFSKSNDANDKIKKESLSSLRFFDMSMKSIFSENPKNPSELDIQRDRIRSAFSFVSVFSDKLEGQEKNSFISHIYEKVKSIMDGKDEDISTDCKPSQSIKRAMNYELSKLIQKIPTEDVIKTVNESPSSISVAS